MSLLSLWFFIEPWPHTVPLGGMDANPFLQGTVLLSILGGPLWVLLLSVLVSECVECQSVMCPAAAQL